MSESASSDRHSRITKAEEETERASRTGARMPQCPAWHRLHVAPGGQTQLSLGRLRVPKGEHMANITINSGTSYRPAEWYQQHGMDITRFAEFHAEMEDICVGMEEAGIRWSYAIKVSEWSVDEYGEASLGYDIVIEAECSDEELRDSLDICLLPGE